MSRHPNPGRARDLVQIAAAVVGTAAAAQVVRNPLSDEEKDAMLTDHAKREIAALERIGADTGRSPVERAKALLTAHQRYEADLCLCGWNQLGRSHAGHQADVLDRAGLLTAQETEETTCRNP